MRKVLVVLLATSLAVPPALAGSFGIDFSPLREPGFGKRRDYGVDPPADAYGGTSAREQRPAGPSPEMRRLGRELDDSRARLSRDIIEIPEEAPMPDGGFEFVNAETRIGDAMFNLDSADYTFVSQLPANYHPPLRVSSEGLSAAAVILDYAAGETETCGDADILALEDEHVATCETSAFLAGQAGLAMEGLGSLRVRLEPDLREVTSEDRAAADRAMAEWSAALNAVASARLERREAEILLNRNPIDYRTDSAEDVQRKEQFAARYHEAVRLERLAGERFYGAQRDLRNAVVRAGRTTFP